MMNLPTTLIGLIEFAMLLLVPAIAGWGASRLLDRFSWFQMNADKPMLVLVISALLGFALQLLKQWVMGRPDVSAAVDPYISLFVATLVIYTSSQVSYGVKVATRRRLSLEKMNDWMAQAADEYAQATKAVAQAEKPAEDVKG
jgi:hypothetical protein